jgi:hypothetical protein
MDRMSSNTYINIIWQIWGQFNHPLTADGGRSTVILNFNIYQFFNCRRHWLLMNLYLDHRWPSLTADRKSEELRNYRRPSAVGGCLNCPLVTLLPTNILMLRIFLFLLFLGSATSCASPPPWPSIFSNYSFRIHQLVKRDDRHLLAHAMASDFSVAWQFLSKRTIGFLLQIILHTQYAAHILGVCN